MENSGSCHNIDISCIFNDKDPNENFLKIKNSLTKILHTFMFSSDEEGNLKQWDMSNFRLYKNWGQIQRNGISSIAVTQDGQYLFTSGSKGVLNQWSTINSKRIQRFKKSKPISRRYSRFTAKNHLNKIFIISEGNGKTDNMICAIDNTFTLTIWRIKNFEQCYNFEQLHGKDGSFYNSPAITSDNEYQFTGDSNLNGDLTQWSLKDKIFKRYIQSGKFEKLIKSLCKGPNGKQKKYASRGNDSEGLIETGESEDDAEVDIQEYIKNQIEDSGITMCPMDYDQKVRTRGISCLAVTHNDEFLFKGDLEGHLQQFSIKKQKLVRNFGKVAKSEITQIVFSLDQKTGFIGDSSGYIYQFVFQKTGEMKFVKDFKVCTSISRYKSGVCSFLITRNGRYLIIGDKNGCIKVWNIKRCMLVKGMLKIHDGWVSDLKICQTDYKVNEYFKYNGADLDNEVGDDGDSYIYSDDPYGDYGDSGEESD